MLQVINSNGLKNNNSRKGVVRKAAVSGEGDDPTVLGDYCPVILSEPGLSLSLVSPGLDG